MSATPNSDNEPKLNTDRELWREREGDYYADSIHVTEGGGIGINCGGSVYVKTLRAWHKLADTTPNSDNLNQCAQRAAEKVTAHAQERMKWIAGDDPILYPGIVRDLIAAEFQGMPREYNRGSVTHWQTRAAQAEGRNQEQAQELALARADTARLDWLEQSRCKVEPYASKGTGTFTIDGRDYYGPTVRDAIDAARAALEP